MDELKAGKKGKGLTAHLVFPEGGSPKRCTLLAPMYESEAPGIAASKAFENNEFERGKWYSFTIEFKPVGTGPNEYRNIKGAVPIECSPPVVTKEAGRSTGWRSRPEEETESIERNSALERAVTVVMTASTGESLPVLVEKISETTEVFAALIHKQVWSNDQPAGATGAIRIPDDAPTEEEAEAPAPLDYEAERVRVLEAAGGNSALITQTIQQMGFGSFADMDATEIEDLISKLAAELTRAATF